MVIPPKDYGYCDTNNSTPKAGVLQVASFLTQRRLD